MSKKLAEVAAIDPGSAGGTKDEVVGFACYWRGAGDLMRKLSIAREQGTALLAALQLTRKFLKVAHPIFPSPVWSASSSRLTKIGIDLAMLSSEAGHA